MGLEPTNLLRATQALYQLSYAPRVRGQDTGPAPCIELVTVAVACHTPSIVGAWR